MQRKKIAAIRYNYKCTIFSKDWFKSCLKLFHAVGHLWVHDRVGVCVWESYYWYIVPIFWRKKKTTNTNNLVARHLLELLVFFFFPVFLVCVSQHRLTPAKGNGQLGHAEERTTPAHSGEQNQTLERGVREIEIHCLRFRPIHLFIWYDMIWEERGRFDSSTRGAVLLLPSKKKLQDQYCSRQHFTRSNWAFYVCFTLSLYPLRNDQMNYHSFFHLNRKFATSSHVQSLYLIILSSCITCLSITSFHPITGTCQYPQPIYRDRLWTPNRHLSLYPSSHLKQYGAFAQKGYFNLFVALSFVLACTVPRIGPR